jgi:CBS domain-containing protein
MAETGITRFPVVETNGRPRLVGMIALQDLLQARVRNLQEERRRERALRTRLPFARSPRPVAEEAS